MPSHDSNQDVLQELRRNEELSTLVEIGKALASTSRPSTIRVTASFGVATFPQDAGNKDELLGRADQAMYLAKETARDSVRSA